MRLIIFTVFTLLLSLPALAATTKAKAQQAEPDFDTLGGNSVLLERARAMDPDTNISVVQNRMVNRHHRVEFAPEVSGVFGGDTYSSTRSIGLNAYYHFNSHWSIGAKYNYSFNKLTSEGNNLFDKANQDFQNNPGSPSAPFPEVDYPKSEALALVNWYPIYGKLDLFEKSIVHFDLYAIGGAGTTQLKSGSTSTYTAGGGLGLWFTQHFTTRMEMRYQTYQAKYLTGPKRLDLVVGSLQMGWML